MDGRAARNVSVARSPHAARRRIGAAAVRASRSRNFLDDLVFPAALEVDADGPTRDGVGKPAKPGDRLGGERGEVPIADAGPVADTEGRSS